MAAMMKWVVAASVLTIVIDWAGWHFVWRHEFEEGEAVERKRNLTSLFFSYLLPLMPLFAAVTSGYWLLLETDSLHYQIFF